MKITPPGDRFYTDFFLLGCLDEYLGRGQANYTELERKRIEPFSSADEVESFYGDQACAARLFGIYLRRLSKEEGIQTTIRQRRYSAGCISWFSVELRERLDSMYCRTSAMEWKPVPAFFYKRLGADPDTRMLSSIELFDGMPNAEVREHCMISYLAGAYARYGETNSFNFANSYHKVALIADLLLRLNCTNMTITVGEGIPSSLHLNFSPTERLSRWFSLVRRQLAETKTEEEGAPPPEGYPDKRIMKDVFHADSEYDGQSGRPN